MGGQTSSLVNSSLGRTATFVDRPVDERLKFKVVVSVSSLFFSCALLFCTEGFPDLHRHIEDFFPLFRVLNHGAQGGRVGRQA